MTAKPSSPGPASASDLEGGLELGGSSALDDFKPPYHVEKMDGHQEEAAKDSVPPTWHLYALRTSHAKLIGREGADVGSGAGYGKLYVEESICHK